MKQERNECVFRAIDQRIFSILILFIVLLSVINFTVSISSGAPTSPGDKWKIAFDPAMDLPYNYSTEFKPKVWLYDQGNSLITTGATVSYTYVNVNTGSTIGSGPATSNGDGSYTGGTINMPAYARNYINIKFSVPQNSNVISQQTVVFADNSEASKGAVWKISVFNTSYGPSWDRTQKHNVYMTLYSDARTPMKNQIEAPTIIVKNSIGTIVNTSIMTYLENGIYRFTLSPNTISSDGEYYFEITSRWSSRTITGGKSKYTTAISGFNIEAVGNMGDTIAPDVVNWKQSPNFPTPIDNVTLSVDVVDNVNVSSVTAYYSVNNGSTQSIQMYDGTFTYSGKISKYLMEDHIRYRISASDGVNVQDGPITDYVVSEPAGNPNTSFSYLNHPVYYFGYSRAGTTYDEGGDTGGDGTWTTGEKDGVYYMQANAQVYTFFRDMTTIKIKTMVLDSKGKPVRGLTNVKAWLQANKTQSTGARNANKTMSEVPGEDGVYTATWLGSPAMSGSSVTWNQSGNNDAKVIWGKYDSGQIYSVYVDFNNDSVADENITWLAYNFMDTFVGSAEDGKGLHGANIESSNGCSRPCHQGMIGSTSRIDEEPTCADCHGVEKTANGGSWPISGNTGATDKILYGNSSSHSRLNISSNSTYCGDESCHNSPWGVTPVNPAPIPGYNPGESLDKMFNNSGYPVPSQCAECHNYTSRTIPSVDGHNAMINCKFCHGSYHRQHKLTDYIVASVPVKDDVTRGTPGYEGTGGEKGSGKYPGNCYKDCHKTQVEHSLVGRQGNPVNEIVPCDECHKNFDNKSMHLDDVGPYDDRNTCGGCHQVNQTVTHNISYSMNPPIVTDPVRHSENITGNKWNRTGTRPFWAEYENSCRFCHGRSYNDAYGLGRNRDHMGTNQINGTINSTSYWCASCHVDTYQSGSVTYNDMVKTYNDSFGVVPPEITGNATWKSDRSGYIDHQAREYTNRSNSSTFSDDICYVCHGLLANSSSMTLFMHNVDLGKARGAGPDCISCHDIGKDESEYHIDNTAMSNGVHANLNKNAANSSGVPAANKKCWGCHDSNGSQPSEKEKGDRVANAYKCYDCHNSTSKPHSNVSNAPNVSEHFKSGTQIKAATSAQNNSLSCLVCHNLSEMKVPYTEDDTYIFNYSIVSHYGKKRTDLRSWDGGKAVDCSYCHQNISTAFFAAMVDPSNNKSISNHTQVNSPECFNSNCHGSGWIHNMTLEKPLLTLPNTTYCLTCHAGKQKHNGTLECSTCHLQTKKNIHPVQYLQPDNTWKQNSAANKSSAVNCTTCHQGTMAGFTTARKVPTPMNHSTNPYSGAMWNGTQLKYWTNTSQKTSCDYCHTTSALHNQSGLGKIFTIKGSNSVRQPLAGGYWCTSCHYDDGTSKYQGSLYAIKPPEILNKTAIVPAIARDGTSFVNHSGYVSTYDDAACNNCHKKDLNLGITSLNLSHNINTGSSGGLNCTSCHDIGGIAEFDVDIANMNNGVHANLNNRSQYTGGNITNRKCWACHGTLNANGYANESNQPVEEHNQSMFKTPRKCPDCHTNLQSTTNFSAPQVVEHQSLAPDAITPGVKCSLCHNNSLTAIHENDGFGISDGQNASVSHYGSVDSLINTSKCLTCHYNATYSNNASWGSPTNISTNHDADRRSNCDTCHNDGSVQALSQVDFHNPGIKLASMDDCIGCHTLAQPPYPAINTILFGKHKNVNITGDQDNLTNDDCTTCHYDYNYTVMKQTGFGTPTKVCADCHTSGNYGAQNISNHKLGGTNITTAAYCTVCHNNSVNQYGLTPNASSSHYGTKTNLIATQDCTWCHKNPVNASIWGNAVDPASSGTFPHSISTTPKEDCYACHNSAINFHNISLQKPLVSSVNCTDCHKTERAMANKEIDMTVLATAVHKNRICENCHTNATDSNMNDYSLITDPAKECTLCHTGTGSLGAPIVKEHNENGNDVITAANCTLCHWNGGMYLPNIGTNGTGSAITHYLKDVTNTGTTPYQHNGTINTSHCLTCHYNATYSNNASWGSPTNIGASHDADRRSNCDTCHNDGNVASLAFVDFHNASVQLASTNDCMNCHKLDTGLDGMYAAINASIFGKHKNVNGTGGDNNLTSDDCTTCHYNFDFNVMNQSGFTTPTRECTDCHTSGIFNATIISNHKPGSVNISTTAYCSSCHNNSVNMYAYSSNASSGHYGTRTGLISSSDCTTCHKNPANASIWGDASDPASSGTFPHSIANTPTEDCYACHNSVSDFHNISLQNPAVSSVNCLDCHKTTATMANKEIDASVIASSSHKNRDCEDCHSGANNTNMNTYSLTTDPAPICADCHTGAGQYNAPLVAEHNEFGDEVITVAACTLCHSNSGMYLPNSGTNGTGSAITHYIKEVTNLSTLPYGHNGTIDTSNCIICHNGPYTNNSSWGSPVNISTSVRKHSETLTTECDLCHKDNTISSLALVDFHNINVQPITLDKCITCHGINGSSQTRVDEISIGMHRNVNNTDGGISNLDCQTCHFNFTEMGIGYEAKQGVNVYICDNCHLNQSTQSRVSEHYPGADVNVTTRDCENCHSNSINTPNSTSTVNTTIGNVTHYGTTANLVKPTAGTYNTACKICHDSTTNKTLYGVESKQVTLGHTSAATCDNCHVNSASSADNLHNISLEMPDTNNCQVCHTTFADKYGAPNLTGLNKGGLGSCNGGSCHGTDITSNLDTLAKHNVNRIKAGTGGSTTNVYLNNQDSLTVTMGVSVNITSSVNDATGLASKVRGAEYYIDVDPGQGKGTPMAAADGNYNAINGAYENVVATLDTSSLSGGNHIVYVRGMDIGKQWSASKNATFIVLTLGYINGTVTNATSSPVSGVYVSVAGANYTTGLDGTYSLIVPDGTYIVNASKQPEFYDYTGTPEIVTPLNTTNVDIPMDQKPTGTISGLVRNI